MCLYVHHMNAVAPRSQKALDSPGTGVTQVSCKPPPVVTGTNVRSSTKAERILYRSSISLVHVHLFLVVLYCVLFCLKRVQTATAHLITLLPQEKLSCEKATELTNQNST